MALKILSVDDEADLEILLTQYFRRKIKKGEYEFSFAHNGVEALKMLLEHPDFDIILSDINMPEMDQPGPEVHHGICLRRHGQHPQRHEPGRL